MKKFILNLFLFFLLGCGCNQEETIPVQKEGDVITQKPFIWFSKEDLHTTELNSTPIYQKKILKEVNINSKVSLALIDIYNGIINWKWDDFEKESDIGIDYTYNLGQLLTFQSGPRSYCINLETGKTEWKRIRDNSYSSKISGSMNEYYLIQYYSNEGDIFPGFYIVDLITGIVKEKIIPRFENGNKKNVLGESGGVKGVKSIFSNGKEYLMITYSEAIDIYNSTSLISLYNYSDKKWVYEHKAITGFDILSPPEIYNDKVYHFVGYHITCNNLWTGDSIWTRQFNGTFGFGQFIIDNGTLYCAAETDGYYALDAETGAIKWKGERSPGTSSHMAILNGVLYYINGADGRLWALDAATGKTLWRLKSPDSFGFKREINVMPGDGIRKGYVLTSTWHGACAYEAER